MVIDPGGERLVRKKHVILQRSSIKLQWIYISLKSAVLSGLIVSCTLMT